LLPSGVHYKRVVEWLHREAKRLGSTVVAVNLISAKTGMGIDELASNIEYYRRDRSDVFVMGTANAGKSTFVNALIDVFKGPKDKRPTISPMPGTTLGMIRFPIGTNAFLYDTPGIITKKQIVNYLLEDEIKLVLPIKQVNPVVHRIAPGRTIFIGGFGNLFSLTA
jgi:ribosome biogenesis GTPase A